MVEDDVLLYCGGVPLEDSSSLNDCVANLATVEVLSRLLGGLSKTLDLINLLAPLGDLFS